VNNLFTDYLFNCSDLDILVPSKKIDSISLTQKDKLYKIFLKERYGYSEVIDNKYIQKGKMLEQEGVDMVLAGREAKLQERLVSDLVKGYADVVLPDMAIDIKTKWDPVTFLKSEPEDYKYQVMGYCYCLGLTKGAVAHVLLPNPDYLVEDEIKKHFWAFNKKSAIDPEYDPDNDVEYIKIKNQIIENNEIVKTKLQTYKIYNFEFTNEDFDNLKARIQVLRNELGSIKL